MSTFRFRPFSEKQQKILTWWLPSSPVRGRDGVIADGAIRSGKTLAMSLSFVFWAMSQFEGASFAMCGKTIGSFRRNVLFLLEHMLAARGYGMHDLRSQNVLVITHGERKNYFYLFGGKDERSQDLIQGITLAGVFFDEAALMPESFVNQATGRCSVEGSKFWFNCNPAGPQHWFKKNWIDVCGRRNLLRLHFTMEDNLSLSEAVRRRYETLYSGVFYRRYVLGEWVMAEGAVYDMFDEAVHVVPEEERVYSEYYVSVDYGTQNPTVFLLWGLSDGVWYGVREYYYSGRDEGRQMTDGQYADAMEAFLEGVRVQAVIVDPSAASFIAELRGRGYAVRKANNQVADGIRQVGRLLADGRLVLCQGCRETVREFRSYVWDAAAGNAGVDRPVKQNDHCMDAVRYFCMTVVRREGRRNYSR